MKDGNGNESTFAYPEVLPGITEWANSTDPEPKTITVTTAGLRSLLQLLGDCWPLAAGAYMEIHVPTARDGMYASALTPKAMRDMMNRLSEIWCGDDLVVSGLFLNERGQPALNECVERK